MDDYLAFSLFDKNRDGAISRNEMKEYLIQIFMLAHTMSGRPEDNLATQSATRKAEEAAERCFQEADIDGDGTVSFAEFRTWYARRLNGSDDDAALADAAGGATFEVSIPRATICYFSGIDASGERVYQSANSLERSVRTRYKDTFVAFVMHITMGARSWVILRRYSSLAGFVALLRKTALAIDEPCAFPPKRVFGEVNVEARRQALQTYFQAVLAPREVHTDPFVKAFLQRSDAQHQERVEQPSPAPPASRAALARAGSVRRQSPVRAEIARNGGLLIVTVRQPAAIANEPGAGAQCGNAMVSKLRELDDLGAVTLMTLEGSASQSTKSMVTQMVREALGEARGTIAIQDPFFLALVERLREADFNGDGFVSSFDLGTIVANSGLSLPPGCAMDIVRQTDHGGGRVALFEFVRLLMRQVATPPPPPTPTQRAAEVSGRVAPGAPGEYVTVSIVATLGGAGPSTAAPQALPAAAVGVDAAPAGASAVEAPAPAPARSMSTTATYTADDVQFASFKSMVKAGFDVFMHDRKGQGNSLRRTQRRMQTGADMARLAYKKLGIKGAAGITVDFDLQVVRRVVPVEPGSDLASNFRVDPTRVGCYFVIEAPERSLFLEATDAAQRDFLVAGFDRLCLRSGGVHEGHLPGAQGGETGELLRAFRVFDTNDDGYISTYELAQALSRLGYHLSEQDVQEMMARSDVNGDGHLDYQEFAALMHGRDEEEEMLKAFRVFDKNGDGFISAFELSQTLANLGESLSRDEIAEIIARVDSNGDGQLDFEEFCTMMREKARADAAAAGGGTAGTDE